MKETSRAKRAKSAQNRPTVAIHAQKGTRHVVGLGNIRVAIVTDGPVFFAQGLEIDYAAQGKTLDEAKANFQTGLAATIEQHLQLNGDIKGLLRVAPPDVWQEFLLAPSTLHSFSSITGHRVHKALPFEGISFLVPKNDVGTDVCV